MKIACTGFVSSTAGSVAAANGILLNSLLDRGFEIDFFSKPSFVDPRPIIGNKPRFRFVAVNNRVLNFVRAQVETVPLVRIAASTADAYSYNRLVAGTIGREHRKRAYDLCLWLGDYARDSVPGLRTISFAQGPPGTDARSVLLRYSEIRRLVSPAHALKWRILAGLRLSPLGKPPLHNSDHFIVGSRQSSSTLTRIYSVDPQRIFVLPYPIDLHLFRPLCAPPKSRSLRVLWLGRIVPRKRLDIFLDGASLAIKKGIDIRLTLVGSSGFIPGYETMIRSFPFPDRLEYRKRVDRAQVPILLSQHDVLAQPSDEENFGSSVAEAQACGLPVIVGRTNGNADYLSPRDLHLADECPETFAKALAEMSRRKLLDKLGEPAISRTLAEKTFHVDSVVSRLIQILQSVI